MLIHPHDNSERAKVPFDLLAHVRLLDLDGDPVVRTVRGLKLGAVDLGYAGTRRRLLLEDLEYAIRASWETTELGQENLLDD